MNFFTVGVLVCVLVAPAAAQTRIGGVTLTPVGQPAPTQAAQPASGSRVNDHTYVPVGPGLRELRGRLTVAREGLRLPAGSRVSVSIHDAQTGRSVIAIAFTATRLSTPYQMIFSPGRVATTRRHVVRAVVTDPSGKVLYSSADISLPSDLRATLTIPLRAR